MTFIRMFIVCLLTDGIIINELPCQQLLCNKMNSIVLRLLFITNCTLQSKNVLCHSKMYFPVNTILINQVLIPNCYLVEK